MKAHLVLTIGALAIIAGRLGAQSKERVSGGEVSRSSSIRADPSRLTTRISTAEPHQRHRIQISGDSAQRMAIDDFAWNGRVISVELDEQDARLYWDVKIIPDEKDETIVRYRVDAWSGGILSIKEFAGVRGLAKQRP